MKIVFLLTQDLESPGGLGRYFPLARELVLLGHQVTIIALHPNYTNLTDRAFAAEGVEIRYVASMHVRKIGNTKSYYSSYKLLILTVWATWRLSLAALSTQADIIHIGKPHPMNSLAGLITKYLRGAQLYLDCDDFEAEAGRFKSRWQKLGVAFFEDKMPHLVDYITTHTFFNQNRIISSGISPEHVFYLSNGVDRNRFATPAPEILHELRSNLGLTEKKVVLYLGSLSLPSHPVDLLLGAFKQIVQMEPLARLLLVGGGEDYDYLILQVKEMGLSDVVVFTGRVFASEAALYYYLADVSVDPVHDDNAARGRSPLKLFESWACGVPFVSADVGDRQKLLGSPPAGLLAQPGDAESLSSAIYQILSDPDIAEIFRKRGIERVKSYYWDKLALELEKIYIQTNDNKLPHTSLK